MCAPGPPILLLHGFATSCERTWRDTGWIDLLGDAGRDVIGLDFLGHGDAPKPHDPAVYDLEGQVVAALPPSGEPVDAIGFSLGARVLLTVAAADPARFGRIVVAGVGENLFRDDGAGEILARAVAGGAGDNPVGRHFEALASAPGSDRDALLACLRRPSPPLTPRQLGRVTVPVLVVLGDRDFAGPPEPLVDALPDARLVTLRGVDHFATPKDFGFIDAALEFLGAVPA